MGKEKVITIIKSEVKKQGISRNQLAKETGIGKSTIYRLFEGYASVNTLHTLVKHLNLDDKWHHIEDYIE